MQPRSLFDSGQHIKDKDNRLCPRLKKVLQGSRALVGTHVKIFRRTDLMTSTTPLRRETILMISDSSALTGWSIPLPESTTVLFARQPASLQIQLSPAMASCNPNNWHSTSSPPTQRSTQFTQVLSTAAFKPWPLSRLLALRRTAKTLKS